MIEPFLYSFFIVFLSEFFDKTQLVIFSTGLRYRNKLQVFTGALSAHLIMDLIAILLGYFLASLAYLELIRFSVAIGFILIGFVALLRRDKRGKEFYHFRSGFTAGFITVAASELGDKTQFASGLLAARFSNIWLVLSGVMAALALAIGINLIIGKRLEGRISDNTVRILNGFVFVAVGILMLI